MKCSSSSCYNEAKKNCKQCADCLADKLDRTKMYRKVYAEKGLCNVCGKPLEEGNKTPKCQVCKNRHNQTKKEKRLKLKAEMKCFTCEKDISKEPLNKKGKHFNNCAVCRKEINTRQKGYYDSDADFRASVRKRALDYYYDKKKSDTQDSVSKV